MEIKELLKNKKTKKILNMALTVFTWIVVGIAIFMMIFTIISAATFDKNDRSLFGIKFYIVQTDSMSKSEKNKDMVIHFDAGDIVLIKEVKDATKLKAGDVIAFISVNATSYGSTVTHMIREVKTDDSGKLIGYVTYGTNTGTNDEALVEPDFVMGKYTGKLSKIGYFFQFLKTTPGYIICILVPFLILIAYQGLNCIKLFRKYKGEQLSEIQKERIKIEEERRQASEMLKELQELKAQLSKDENSKL